MKNRGAIFYSVLFVFGLFYGLNESYADDASLPIFGDTSQQKKKIEAAEKIEERREAAEREKRKEAQEAKQKEVEKAKAKDEKLIEKLTLPEDTTLQFTVKQVLIKGNTLISTEKLLKDLPLIYNASNKPLEQAETTSLYDFRILRDIILNPGQTREISTRTIEAFTIYLVSVYQKQNYAGIYVRVQPDAIKEAKLKEDILPIEVIEIPVTNIVITSFDVEHNIKEEGFLSKDLIKEWSPVESGQVANQKELDDFINLLNLNPDRYVSATISEGATPGSLAVGYDVYEVDPWHYFIQIDNAGTDDRKWTPRLGLINTNLTGRDDKLTIMAQGAPEKGIEDNYSVYGSYDFPLWTPRLRLNIFGGRSEYEVDGGGGIDFLGHGSLYGGKLRFNVLQHNGWFFDVTSSLSQEKSKVTSSLFSQFFGNQVTVNLWGIGVEAYQRNDISSTSLAIDRVQSLSGGSGQSHYWDSVSSTGARTNADQDFEILTFSANHSRFLDPDKIHRFLGTFKYIRPNARLIPAKMTTFGGMYSVRGYEESRIVADGGLLASLQYEYDLVKKEQREESSSNGAQDKKTWLKKLAPLAFIDFGRAQIKDSVAGENGAKELVSIGTGLIVEIGEHFNGAVYYGFPLRRTDTTRSKDGRLNIGLMLRW